MKHLAVLPTVVLALVTGGYAGEPGSGGDGQRYVTRADLLHLFGWLQSPLLIPFGEILEGYAVVLHREHLSEGMT